MLLITLDPNSKEEIIDIETENEIPLHSESWSIILFVSEYNHCLDKTNHI